MLLYEHNRPFSNMISYFWGRHGDNKKILKHSISNIDCVREYENFHATQKTRDDKSSDTDDKGQHMDNKFLDYLI